MRLSEEDCYQAMRSRDRRFEGSFFIVVRTTGIYCRPGCPARTPKRENVSFVATAAAAEAEGYRPCKRCRPEAGPGRDAWDRAPAVVARAVRAIHEGALDEGSVTSLAERCGVGARHLSRLFREQLGAAPVAIAQTRRVHFARRLIDQTDLSMIQIALGSGFQSVRRFNAAIRATFGCSPTDLRRGRGLAVREGELTLSLPYRPPYDWSALRRFVAARSIPGVETWVDERYRRRVATDYGHGVLSVRPDPATDRVEITIPSSLSRALPELVASVQRLFDLDADPLVMRSVTEELGRPGIRVPGAFCGFEVAVRAVLGQQVTVAGATTLSGRLVERYGTCWESGPFGSTFPSASALVRRRLESLGMPGQRAAAIRHLARAVEDGRIELTPSADPALMRERLADLPGIGRWTADYVAMRVLRYPDAFPDTDLGLRKALSSDRLPVAARQVRELAAAWQPWRSYAAMALWDRLARDDQNS